MSKHAGLSEPLSGHASLACPPPCADLGCPGRSASADSACARRPRRAAATSAASQPSGGSPGACGAGACAALAGSGACDLREPQALAARPPARCAAGAAAGVTGWGMH